MKLLLVDTCGASASVALADRGTVVTEEALPGRSASERLVPAVRALLEGLGWRLAELDAIAVVRGPGSFTGIRVGLSAAKGLSLGSGVPLIGLSRLSVLADTARAECVALDAGRGEFFFGDYRGGGIVEEHRTREELLAALGRHELVVCEARAAEALAGVAQVRLVAEPGAAAALKLATGRVLARRFEDVSTLDAHYVNRSEGSLYTKSSPPAAP